MGSMSFGVELGGLVAVVSFFTIEHFLASFCLGSVDVMGGREQSLGLEHVYAFSSVFLE